MASSGSLRSRAALRRLLPAAAAAAVVLVVTQLPCARAIGLPGEEGVPETIATDSDDVREAAAAALRELNVRVHHYCRSQGPFETQEVASAARAVISDAEEIELVLRLDGRHRTLVGLKQGDRGKYSLVRSEPYACEVRGAEMTINSRGDIEKHNADPTRTFDRAPYKRFEGLTDSQVSRMLLRNVMPPPEGVPVEEVTVDLDPEKALQAALDAEKRRKRGGGGSSGGASGPSYDLRSALGGVCDPTPNVRDQGSCASCWAQSNAEMLEDRICLATKGAVRVKLSTQQHVSCDRLCWPQPHDRYCNNGCDGGYQVLAGEYTETVGLVEDPVLPYASGTGGSYEDHFGSTDDSGACPAALSAHGHYRAARGSTQMIKRHDVASMQAALVNGGSLDAAIMVYQEFFTYRSGVYIYRGRSPQAGGHAVKLIGFGEDGGVPYWLAQNSWGRRWGEDGGFFRIRRGTNEAAIESSVVMLQPDLTTSFAALSSPIVSAGRGSHVTVGHHAGAARVQVALALAAEEADAAADAAVDGGLAGAQRAAAGASTVGKSAVGEVQGRVEVVPAHAAADGEDGVEAVLSVEADGAEGVTDVDTSALAPGVYAVRYCAAGRCVRLDDKVAVTKCPTRDGLICGGHGVCDEETGDCDCDGGYAGAACEATCGPLPRLVCGCTHVGGVWDGMASVTGGPGADALYSLTLKRRATVTISTCHGRTDLDTVLAIYKGCPLPGSAASTSPGGAARRSGGGGSTPAPIAIADDEGCGADAGADVDADEPRPPPGATAGAGFGLLRGSVVTAQLPAGEYTVAVSGYDEHSLGDFEVSVQGCEPQAGEQCPVPAPVGAAIAAEAPGAGGGEGESHPACATAVALVEGETLAGDLAADTTAAGSAAGESIFRLVPQREGEIVVTTCGSSLDTEVALYRGCPAAGGHLLGSNDDGCSDGTGGSYVDAQVAPGHTYYARVTGHMGARGPFTVALARERSACAHAKTMRVSPNSRGREWHDTADPCQDEDAAAAGTGPDFSGAAAAVYKLSAGEGMELTVDACAGPAGTSVQLFQGCAGEEAAVPLGDTDGGCAGEGAGAKLTTALRAGMYTVVVSTARAAVGTRCRAFRVKASGVPWRGPTATEASLLPEFTGDGGGQDGSLGDARLTPCVAHGGCASLARAVGEPRFCSYGVCEPCSRCTLCASGVDNTCGPCDPGMFPAKELGPCNASRLVPAIVANGSEPDSDPRPRQPDPGLVLAGCCALVLAVTGVAAAAHARRGGAGAVAREQGTGTAADGEGRSWGTPPTSGPAML